MKEEKYFKSTPMQELFKKYGHLLPDIEKEFLEKEKQQFLQQPSVQLNKTAEEIENILDKHGFNRNYEMDNGRHKENGNEFILDRDEFLKEYTQLHTRRLIFTKQ